MLGFWIYLIVFTLTVVWALWERGFNWWAQVPRLAAPTVLLILIAIAIPALRRMDPEPIRRSARGAMVAIAGIFVIGLAGLAEPLFDAQRVFAQAETPQPPAEVPAAEPDAATEPTPPAGIGATREPEPQIDTGADWPAYGGTYRCAALLAARPDHARERRRARGDLGVPAPATCPRIRRSKATRRRTRRSRSATRSSSARRWASSSASMPPPGARNGATIPEVADDAIPYGATCRGVAYYAVPGAAADELCATRIIWGTLDARLIAVDADTGQLCADFGTNGEVNLEIGIGDTVPGWYAITSPPTIVRGVVVIGAQVHGRPGRGRALGRGPRLRRRHRRACSGPGTSAIPGDTGEPPEGEVYTRGTPNMWTIATGDEELGHVYLPLGNSVGRLLRPQPQSELENEYATSLVALDVTTGRAVWHFQTVHNDVWDYDLGSQATLVDFPAADGTRCPRWCCPASRATSTSSIAAPASRCTGGRGARDAAGRRRAGLPRADPAVLALPHAAPSAT